MRLFIVVIIAILVYAVMRIYIADRFCIPSNSMIPALWPGDDILVDKTLMGARLYTKYDFPKEGGELSCVRTKGLRNIKINDILVCNRYKYHDTVKFVINDLICKRCIGLPGDTVSIVNGFYKNNNFGGIIGDISSQQRLSTSDSTLLNPRSFRAFPKIKQIQWTIKDFGPYYVPRKDDLIKIDARVAAIYRVQLEWELGTSIMVDWNKNAAFANGKRIIKHKFKHNYYFLAGDNVLNSDDSRYKGPVPEEYVIGIASRILYSVDEETGNFRWGRLGKRL